MGEALLHHRLAAAGIDAHVHSAGLVSEGVPASAHGVRALAKRGVDLGAHRSRALTPEMVAQADLVIGMAREHVREAVALRPEAFPRTFTLRELVRRAGAVGPRRPVPGADPGADALEPLDAWLARVSAGRRPTDLLGEHPGDDVADPMGMSRRAYERCATDIEDLVEGLVDLAFPVRRSRSYSA